MPDIEVVELTGIQPIPGPKGDKGDTGEAGPVGPAGPAGAASTVPGPKGDTGETGPRGVQGLTGPIGATGAVGPKGDKGDKGDAGAAGATGPQGPKGDRGDIGPTGATGPAGAPGSAANGVEDFRSEGNVFTIQLTNGSEIEAIYDGAGAVGPAGEDGTSVDSVTINGSYHLITTYTDGRVQDSGALPAGPAGATGPKGDTGPAGAASTVPGPQGPKGDTGNTGPAGAKGDKGDTGATGPKGDTGAAGTAGANGQGVPAGGLPGQILVKVSETDFDAEWVDFPMDVIQQMIDEAVANGGGGGTDPEPEPEPEPVDPEGMTTVRWTANGITSPIPASRAGYPAGTISGDVGPQANGTTLIMARDCFVDFGNNAMAFNLPTTGDYLTTQTPSVLRLAYKGILKPEANVIDLMDWGQADFRVSVPWMEDRLNFTYHRAGGGPEVGEDIGNINDFKLGENHLYEFIWTNDAAGAGGHVRFYIDGAIVGSAMPTAYKVRASNSFWMNINGSMGNTSNSRALEMEYMEIGFKA